MPAANAVSRSPKRAGTAQRGVRDTRRGRSYVSGSRVGTRREQGAVPPGLRSTIGTSAPATRHWGTSEQSAGAVPRGGERSAILWWTDRRDVVRGQEPGAAAPLVEKLDSGSVSDPEGRKHEHRAGDRPRPAENRLPRHVD